MNSLLKKPSAWIPILIPLVFFAYIMTIVTFFGIVREKDEGIGAHLFQLWLVLEPLMVGFFAVKYLPQMPRQALLILAFQIIAALLLVSTVFFLQL